MKKHTGYGTYDLTRQIARRIQLEWDMVEQPSPRPRFLDFPVRDIDPTPAAVPLPRARKEKRPLAA